MLRVSRLRRREGPLWEGSGASRFLIPELAHCTVSHPTFYFSGLSMRMHKPRREPPYTTCLSFSFCTPESARSTDHLSKWEQESLDLRWKNTCLSCCYPLALPP